MARAPQPTPVRAERGLFLTIGVRAGDQGHRDLVRAEQLLNRHGFRVGITSDEAVVAMAEQLAPPAMTPSPEEAEQAAHTLTYAALEGRALEIPGWRLVRRLRARTACQAVQQLVPYYHDPEGQTT